MKRTRQYSQIQENVPVVLPQVAFRASISKYLFLSCIILASLYRRNVALSINVYYSNLLCLLTKLQYL